MPNPRQRQVIAAVSTGMLVSGYMSAWGLPAAVLPQMEEPSSGVNFTQEQSSWFATVPLLICIPGSPIGAKISEVVGPRRTLLILAPLLCIFTMMMSAASLQIVQEAKAVESLLLGCRVAQSVTAASIISIPPIYIYEISDQHLRDMMTGLVEFWATLGFLLCYVAGCFFSWVTITWLIPLITLIPAFIGIFVSPESPLWMARKGQTKEAKNILALLRCTEEERTVDLETAQEKQDNTEEEKAFLTLPRSLKEEQTIDSETAKEKQENTLGAQTSMILLRGKEQEMNLVAAKGKQENTSATCLESVKEATKSHYVKAISASCLLLIMKELGGYVVLSIYVVYIFQQAGVGLDPRWSSVIVGVARMLCNFVASPLWHRYSHRMILLVGNVLIAAATLILGSFFYAQEKGMDVSWLSWLPLFGLVTQIIGASVSVGPGTWALSVEVLPGAVRSLGFGLANACYAIAGFCISKMLLDLQNLIGLKGVFWIFTGGAMGYIVLIVFFIPETRGRSVREIEDHWKNKRK